MIQSQTIGCRARASGFHRHRLTLTPWPRTDHPYAPGSSNRVARGAATLPVHHSLLVYKARPRGRDSHLHDSPTLEQLAMSPSSRQKKRGTRSGQTPAHKHPQVVHGQPGASTGQRQFTNQADQAPQEHADRSTGEQPERSGRGAGHGSSHERAQKKLAGILKNFFERAGYEREEKELARAHKNFFERAGYEAELEPLVGERRVDLRLSIEGRDQFFVFKIVDLVNLVWPETDECDRFNASVEQILDQDQIDRRLTDVENELYQEYRGVPNFTPMVFGMPNSEPFVIGISGRAGPL